MKTGWILGAAFLSLAIVIVALLAATDTATVERLSSSETLDGIDVPVIGTVGDFPDPAHRIVVNVTADGTIVVDGKTLSFAELQDELKVRARRSQVPATDDPVRSVSGEFVVLRVDGALRWDAAAAVVGACHNAAIWRVLVAVRHELDGGEGAMTICLPRGIGWQVQTPGDGTRPSVVIRIGAGTNETSPASLHAAVPLWSTWSLWPDAPNTPWEVSVDRGLPTRAVLAHFDALARAGTTVRWLDCTLDGGDDGSTDLSAAFQLAVARRAGVASPVDVRYGRSSGGDVPRPSPVADPMPAVARKHGETPGFAGVEWGFKVSILPK